jgi:hypothetical protein
MSDTTPIAATIASFQPRTEAVTPRKWKLSDIASRDNALILVVRENPKQPGSDAHKLYPMQGAVGEATVTVAEFLKRGAEISSDKNGSYGPLGSARVRSDLLWNLTKGFVALVDRSGNRL